MVLTAHQGQRVYCGTAAADTLEHEQPLSGNGPDIWWNLVPACKPCNLWKNGRTAREWVKDMKLTHSHPRVFRGRAMKPEVCAGIPARVEGAQREVSDHGRREWFRHHYGSHSKPRSKDELLKALAYCRKTLRRYPHAPWTTPTVDGHPRDECTRRICCGAHHADFRVTFLALGEEDATEFTRRAFEAGLHEADLLGQLVRRYLSEFEQAEPLSEDAPASH